MNLTGEDEPARMRGGFVSENFLRLVGVEPEAGRGFLPGEDQPGDQDKNHLLRRGRRGSVHRSFQSARSETLADAPRAIQPMHCIQTPGC